MLPNLQSWQVQNFTGPVGKEITLVAGVAPATAAVEGRPKSHLAAIRL
jgi:hypothetical protein